MSDDRRRAPAGRKIALHRYRSDRHAIDRVYQKQCGTLLLNSLLDPDQLAAEVPTEHGGYVRWVDLARYAEEHGNKAFEAFAAYKGSHTTDRAGCAYLRDWMEFLAALTKARTTAADPHWEAPCDGVVYRGLA